MTTKPVSPPRCAVLIGPYTSGKTTLLEALLFATGAIRRKGSVNEGNTVGDGSPEARARQMGVEPNFAHAEYLGERWSFIDCPGSVELSQDSRNALMAADVAILVAEPEPDRAITLTPILKFLETYQIPHMIFVNKMDRVSVRVRDLLESLQAISPRPLLLRQVPIRDDENVTGFVDLVSERAYRYQEGKTSELIEMPDVIKEREEEARQELLESLADFDDDLLEQLLEDKIPAPDEVYQQLTKDLQEDKIVPVFLGSAEAGNGITRLIKALRHETPDPAQTAARLGIASQGEFTASVVKTVHQAHTGKLSIARLWHGKIADGATIAGTRLAGLYQVMGQDTEKLAQAGEGDLVALGRLDEVATGDLLTEAGRVAEPAMEWPEVLPPVFSLAVTPLNRADEVKMSTSFAKLIEEDSSLSVEHNQNTHQMLLWGQGEIHLKLGIERLKSKYNVDVEIAPPLTAYKETIRKSVRQHSRFKRQTGGHGQFGDVQVEIKPLPQGQDFEFTNKVVGGAIPRNYIPAVEHGVRDYLGRGPLGFPVVGVAVELFDGQHHAVDSSDQAFRTAGRLAMSEGMPQCDPVLLEPIYEVTIAVPSDFTAKIHGLVSGRRGQILGFETRDGWDGWDELKCYLPQSEIHDLVVELRSLTLGVGSFASHFDHLQPLTGKLADRVIEERKADD
jgi:elongation factor G